ncbi:MAG: response regulator [Methanomicrobiales archaeon]|nr:response regulator [Methanomicrobiales archaeon]
MKIKDLNIGKQLGIGLGIILVLVILMGTVAVIQEASLWQETAGLYEHPLQVRRAIGDLDADLLVMHRGMNTLVLADNDTERAEIIQLIDTREADAYRQFDTLYNLYLGPRSDIDNSYNDFIQWKSIRDESIRLLREGDVAGAKKRVKSTGAGGLHVEKVMADIGKMSDFSKARGDQFYLDAKKHQEDLMVQLVVLLGAILLISLGVFFFLLKRIRDPLRELAAVTEEYRGGRKDARSRYVSTDEIGVLAASFNGLADTVQAELQGKEEAARISEVMLREEELSSFCRELLVTLARFTRSQVGAVYLLNPKKSEFVLFESIGLSHAGRASFSAVEQEGEFGAALATRRIQHITEIPGDTPFVFSAVVGDMRPQEIFTIPVISGHETVAMISLASIHAYSLPAIRLVNDCWLILTARFNGVLAFRKMTEFSELLEEQNRELTEKSRELAQQAEVMREQNAEMTVQANLMREQNTEMTVQAEVMREQNTELEVQKKQLDDANRLKSVFLSNMSHELRTPLNSVIALSGVLNRRLAGKIPEEEYSYLDVIERNGRHLLGLINDILDISRIEAGREEISLSHFTVNELVSMVVAMIGPQAQEKQITLRNLVSDTLPLITSDLSKCQHILQNIVANAVKFTNEGSVDITAAVAGDEIHITVTDTGIGIDQDQVHYIFDEFRQADERIARTYGGSGLGLSIAKKYARLLNASIDVESTVGKGSAFTLRLPLTTPKNLPDDQAAEIKEYSIPAGAGDLQSLPPEKELTVLVVEDSEPAVIQITDILTGQGYKVLVARNGKEALEQIGLELPDAMILDLMMPEVDGFTVLKMVRSNARTALLPVLILTAKHITREELNFLEGNHIHQLIQKGDISRSGLLAAVKTMVSGPRGQERLVAEKTGQKNIPKKPTILIVEDNPDDMLTVRVLLKDRYTIIEATDGRSGIEHVRARTPDLILMDLSMPVMDGITMLSAIRREEHLKHIPVIAVTARAMKGDREEILSYGFNGYHSKPVDGALLLQTIHEVLHET